MPLEEPDFARRIIDFGMTLDDLGGRQPAPVIPMLALALPWPAGLAPNPQPLDNDPSPDDPLPRADVLVVTWTVAEVEALADTLTPGHGRNTWYRYARRFTEHYLPLLRRGAPSLAARRLGSLLPDPDRLQESPLLQVGAAPQPGRHRDRAGARHAAGQGPVPADDRRGQAVAGDHRRHRGRDLPARPQRHHRRHVVSGARAGRRVHHARSEVPPVAGVRPGGVSPASPTAATRSRSRPRGWRRRKRCSPSTPAI